MCTSNAQILSGSQHRVASEHHGSDAGSCTRRHTTIRLKRVKVPDVLMNVQGEILSRTLYRGRMQHG